MVRPDYFALRCRRPPLALTTLFMRHGYCASSLISHPAAIGRACGAVHIRINDVTQVEAAERGLAAALRQGYGWITVHDAARPKAKQLCCCSTILAHTIANRPISHLLAARKGSPTGRRSIEAKRSYFRSGFHPLSYAVRGLFLECMQLGFRVAAVGDRLGLLGCGASCGLLLSEPRHRLLQLVYNRCYFSRPAQAWYE